MVTTRAGSGRQTLAFAALLIALLAGPPLHAATPGDADALTERGLRFEQGDAVEQDWDRARAYYEEAIAAGSREALWRLGRLLAFDHGDPFDDPATGHDLLRQAAEGGDARAAWDLAVIHHDGRDVPPDPGRAADWARQAAPAIPLASMMLAELFTAGAGVDQDLEAARRHARDAAAGDITAGALMLGRMRLLGEGGPVNIDGAEEALAQAHATGHQQATRMLATLLSDGHHREPDFPRARALLRGRAIAGDPHVQIEFARWLVTWNPDGPEIAMGWFWVQVAAPYRGRFDEGWDALWHELDEALTQRLAATEREEIRATARDWRPGQVPPSF
jgi:TPR repeat protein